MKYMRHQARQPNICSSMTKCSNPLSANRLFMFLESRSIVNFFPYYLCGCNSDDCMRKQ